MRKLGLALLAIALAGLLIVSLSTARVVRNTVDFQHADSTSVAIAVTGVDTSQTLSLFDQDEAFLNKLSLALTAVKRNDSSNVVPSFQVSEDATNWSTIASVLSTVRGTGATVYSIQNATLTNVPPAKYYRVIFTGSMAAAETTDVSAKLIEYYKASDR